MMAHPGRGAALVEADGLVHIYKKDDLEVVALQGLDLRLEEGELIAVVGRSGSGKTTLLNVLAALEAPSAGRLMVDGRDLTRLIASEREAYRRDTVGYMWQHSQRNLLPALNSLENVQVPMLAIAAEAARGERARGLLDALGLGHRLKHRPVQLSGGERQRLALAVALANQPRLLLVDEPTSELDNESSEDLMRDVAALLMDLRVGTIMVTHDPALGRHVDRVVQIREGRTSTETRYVERDQGLVADELTIVDRFGRLQIPLHLLKELGLDSLVRIHRDGDGLRISPARGRRGRE